MRDNEQPVSISILQPIPFISSLHVKQFRQTKICSVYLEINWASIYFVLFLHSSWLFLIPAEFLAFLLTFLKPISIMIPILIIRNMVIPLLDSAYEACTTYVRNECTISQISVLHRMFYLKQAFYLLHRDSHFYNNQRHSLQILCQFGWLSNNLSSENGHFVAVLISRKKVSCESRLKKLTNVQKINILIVQYIPTNSCLTI